MKTLIISVYDSFWNYSVFPDTEDEKKIYDLYQWCDDEAILKEYGNKYDVIIACVDGSINIIKGAEHLHG